MDSRLQAFVQWMVSEWNGRTVGRTTDYALNFDRRFGNQCMDLWNWTWTFLGIPSTAIKRTADAAGVWELPATDPIWEYFDGILPHETFHPGDTFVYNRNAFGAQGRGAGNGYGHIGMVVKDNGDGTFQVLEANGLGDGYEDEYLNQYGSPARLHTWSKADLYGVLRPIPSKCPGLNNFGGAASILPTGNTTSEEEDDMALSAEDRKLMQAMHDVTRDFLAKATQAQHDVTRVHLTNVTQAQNDVTRAHIIKSVGSATQAQADVTRQYLSDRITEGVKPSEVADSVIAALGTDLAKQVATELGNRLAAGDEE